MLNYSHSGKKPLSIFHKLRNFSYSMTQLGFSYSFILILIAALSLTSAAIYYNRQLETQYYENVNSVLTHFNNETALSLSTIENYLFRLGQSDANITILNTTKDSNTFYHAKMTLYQTMQTNANVFPYLSGMFVYSVLSEEYTPYITLSSSTECSEYIYTTLRENLDSVLQKEDTYQKWTLYEGQTDYYLIRYVVSGSSILGGWIRLPSLSENFKNVFDKNAIVCFMDESHRMLDPDLFPSYHYQETESGTYEQYLEKQTNTKYLVVSQRISHTDCHITIFLPLEKLSSQLFEIYTRFILIAVLIILLVLGISILLRRLTNIPVRSMNTLLNSIQEGEEEALLPAHSSRCREINQLHQVLNTMIQQIRSLKIQIYEEELEKNRLELQFLKTQISPHFLINCLTTFSFLASSSEDNKLLAKRLSETLSQHIRYSFCSKDLIPLSQEKDHMDNYLELACIRYPNSLAYQFQIPPECETCMLPPMLLLTLCENTIKHNLIMGEKLRILVRAERIEADSNTDTPAHFHICYIDSGSGYPPEILSLNNQILEHPEIMTEGYHIGIYNIAKTLDISCRQKASISFSNEPDMGARVDIFLPL